MYPVIHPFILPASQPASESRLSSWYWEWLGEQGTIPTLKELTALSGDTYLALCFRSK